MFWIYEEWRNAFFIQLLAICVSIVIGKKNGIKNADLLLVIALVSPVAIFKASAGVAGAIFLSDLAAIYLLFRKENPIKNFNVIVLAFALFLLWPVLSRIASSYYQFFSDTIIVFDNKISAIQFFRYSLYFILLAKLVSKPYTNPDYIIKLLKIQSIMLFFVFSAILLGYFKIIKVDAWNELIKAEFYEDTLGIGGMFLYRGGIGTLATISMPLFYFCYHYGKGFYKYFIAVSIYITLIVVIFSGSRQGITFSIIALLFSMILFKQHIQAIKFSFIGLLIGFVLLQNETVKTTSDWVFQRYEILLSDKVDYSKEISNRNNAVAEAEKENKDFFYELSGYGLGAIITPTESDYYNTYSYFGIIGSAIYYFFILFCIYKIWVNRRDERELLMKNIRGISLIVSIVLPLCGFQQWYVMTYNSHSSTNIFLILYLFSFGFFLNTKNRISDNC